MVSIRGGGGRPRAGVGGADQNSGEQMQRSSRNIGKTKKKRRDYLTFDQTNDDSRIFLFEE